MFGERQTKGYPLNLLKTENNPFQDKKFREKHQTRKRWPPTGSHLFSLVAAVEDHLFARGAEVAKRLLLFIGRLWVGLDPKTKVA